MTTSSKIEISGAASSSAAEAPLLTGAYDGREYRLQIKTAQGADGIGLDEDAAQRLARWLGWEAAQGYGRQQADAQWHPRRRPES